MKSVAVRARVLLCGEYLQNAKTAEKQAHFNESWRCLQYAHIVSQPSAKLHLKVHLHMLFFAFRSANRNEIFGQMIRLLLAAPGSLSGNYPKGNLGTSDISMFAVCEIPSDLLERLELLDTA
jgi:Protein of unknown function (DUF3703)